jgi:hypothetical protein
MSILRLRSSSRTWRMTASSGGCDGIMGVVRDNLVTLVSDDRFQADPGAEITTARLAEESAAAAYDEVLNIQGDRSKITFKFRVESGPFHDRWRGSWHGQVVLTQQRDAPPVDAAKCE